jgi:alkylated DNA repair dioxygenase AlkB
MLFASTPLHLNLPDSDIFYFDDFFSDEESQTLFNLLLNEIPWQQDNITLFGKTHKQPRLTALFAENSKPYSYSNITMYPHKFSEVLLKIKTKVEAFSEHKFTTCLANLYRNGNDSNGWHADNEKELGKNPIIASVSFGASRFFHIKHRTEKELKKKLELTSGSLLLMQGETQHNYLHQIAKTKKEIGQRINLTFRIIN